MNDIKDEAQFDDFARLDIRIGTVIAVEPFPRARNPSYKVQVDFGAIGTRWSSAQITGYAPEDLIGTQVCCVVNFAPRNIAGFQSEILILGTPGADGRIVLVSPRTPAPEGAPLC
ncbi:MAG: tRNA-binding protein [Sphingomonadales bacterium]|nr:MAG: tRNA-binding protein [Sphingomonadales bacterium]TNF03401.1 MAG: tRNA-binding protein [Sphingomonadales bacterium]